MAETWEQVGYSAHQQCWTEHAVIIVSQGRTSLMGDVKSLYSEVPICSSANREFRLLTENFVGTAALGCSAALTNISPAESSDDVPNVLR